MKQLYQQKINTKKETKFGLSVITEFVTKSEKMIPKHCPLKCKHILPKWRLLFTKSSFLIFIQLIRLILKQLDPFQGWWTALDIYLNTLCLGIYPPLFTSPLGDSSIIFKRKGKENIKSLKGCCCVKTM